MRVLAYAQSSMNSPKDQRCQSARPPPELASAKQQGYYSIGRAAEITGVTAKMIRHYESIGLMPKVNRTMGDYRVYSATDLHTLRFIRRARDLGFSMKEIEGLLGLWRNQRRASAEVKRLAMTHVAELDHKIAELQAMRSALADLAHHCHGRCPPAMPDSGRSGRAPCVRRHVKHSIMKHDDESHAAAPGQSHGHTHEHEGTGGICRDRQEVATQAAGMFMPMSILERTLCTSCAIRCAG